MTDKSQKTNDAKIPGDIKRRHLHSVLSAAVALASLGETHSLTSRSSSKLEEDPQQKENQVRAEEDDIAQLNFPQKLMKILSDEKNLDSIVWLPHGLAFSVLDRDKFSAEVLPEYFQRTKYPSFTRKLNRWGFTFIGKGPERGSHQHEMFQRDKPHLCKQMRRNNGTANFTKKDPPLTQNSSKAVPTATQQVCMATTQSSTATPTFLLTTKKSDDTDTSKHASGNHLLNSNMTYISHPPSLEIFPEISSPLTISIINAAKRALHRSCVGGPIGQKTKSLHFVSQPKLRTLADMSAFQRELYNPKISTHHSSVVEHRQRESKNITPTRSFPAA